MLYTSIQCRKVDGRLVFAALAGCWPSAFLRILDSGGVQTLDGSTELVGYFALRFDDAAFIRQSVSFHDARGAATPAGAFCTRDEEAVMHHFGL
jgi:hypothetical protein